MRRQRQRADQDRQDRDAPHVAAKQIARCSARRAPCWPLGRVPFLGLGHGAANPQRDQRRQDADQEHVAVSASRPSGKSASEATRMPTLTAVCSTAAIQGRQLRGQVSESSAAPTAHSPPMPSAARKRKISNCHQVCAKYDSPVKSGVGEDRQHQRAAAAHAIADAAEESAAQRPADQERRLDQRAVVPTDGSLLLDGQQLRPRTAPPRACTGACRARRTASPARPRCPTSTARRQVAPAA